MFATVPAHAGKALEIAGYDCDNGVCGFNVTSTLRTPPCTDHTIIVVYGQANGLTLIQCSADDAEDNLSYLYDRRIPGGRVFELDGTRFIKSGALAELAKNGVPDRFAPKPFCSAPASEVPRGTMLMVQKDVSDSGNSPYCYRLLRATLDAAGLHLSGDVVDLPAPSRSASRKWRAMTDTLAPYMRAPVDTAAHGVR